MSLLITSLLFQARGQVLGPWWTKKVVLNAPPISGITGVESITPTPPTTEESSPFDAIEVVKTLRYTMLELENQFMSDDGMLVDYKALKSSPTFGDYVQSARNLANIDMGALDTTTRKSLLINLYNTLNIHGIVEGQIKPFPGGTLSRLRHYASTSYQIGDYIYSLNDIENGLLRGNRLSAAPFTKVPFYSQDDPRLKYCLECDPRIHFALNCGANSCPPISFYSTDPAELEEELDIATESFFISGAVKPDSENMQLVLSKIFSWYLPDFVSKIDSSTKDAELLEWVYSHSPADIKRKIDALKEAASQDGKVKGLPSIKFDNYDWTLNSSS